MSDTGSPSEPSRTPDEGRDVLDDVDDYFAARSPQTVSSSEAQEPASEQAELRLDSRRNWPEDFSHENGLYQNTCIHCGELFQGHKRRVCCKLCAAATPPVSSSVPESVAFDAKAVLTKALKNAAEISEFEKKLDRLEEAQRDYVLFHENPASMGVRGPDAQGFYQSRLISARSALLSEYARMRERAQPSVCNVCGGSGIPTSGLPCICGGVGTEQAELEGFRAQCFEFEREIDALRSRLASLESQTLTASEAKAAEELLGHGMYCSPPADCVCGHFRIVGKLRAISASPQPETPE